MLGLYNHTGFITAALSNHKEKILSISSSIILYCQVQQLQYLPGVPALSIAFISNSEVSEPVFLEQTREIAKVNVLQ